jgi:hypothetical protein
MDGSPGKRVRRLESLIVLAQEGIEDKPKTP